MPVERSVLERLLQEGFPDASITLTDLAGDNDHWSVTVTSPVFQGKTRVQQHKMVFDALQGKMGGELHALQVKTRVQNSEFGVQ